jgi:MFS family permease
MMAISTKTTLVATDKTHHLQGCTKMTASLDVKSCSVSQVSERTGSEDDRTISTEKTQPEVSVRFKSLYSEASFVLAICLTQFLAEYLITGFAIALPRILARRTDVNAQPTGLFWPATLLTLIISAFLLVAARISDKFGGFYPFMVGVIWLAIWSLIAGLAPGVIWLDVSRANQGLGIAFLTPSTFALVADGYDAGRRKNIVLGLYAGCAPLGFFVGFLVASVLPDDDLSWYFWTAAILAAIVAVSTLFSAPRIKSSAAGAHLDMDWAGSFLITAGLLLVTYGLAVIPYTSTDTKDGGLASPLILGPLVSGVVCLIAAVWIEGWVARSPLLPMAFFQAREVQILALTCLFFYASYGVWLYDSVLFLHNSIATGLPGGIQGAQLAIWYTPTAIGGTIICICGGVLLQFVSPNILLCISGFAWVAASLLLALCPTPLRYWSYIVPSMLCVTMGIDLTYTVSLVCITRVQPAHYQALAGAVCSILVNLAVTFSLPISQIISNQAEMKYASSPEYISNSETTRGAHAGLVGLQAAFFYAAASAGVGLVLSVAYACMPASTARRRPSDVEHHGSVELAGSPPP